MPAVDRRCASAFVVAAGWVVASCASSPPPISRIEDKARLDVPIAICRKPLSPSEVGDGGVLRTDMYWSVLFPSFRGFGTALRPDDADCVGELVAADPGASLPALGSDDLTTFTSPDGVQAIWLRSSRVSDAIGAGPLALMRPRTSEIDVYAVGRYRGSLRHSRFEITALGTTRTIVAYDDGCADVKVDVECESNLSFYVAVGGELTAAATSPAQRVHYGTAKGLGRVQYRLTTDPPVADGRTLKVHEKFQVRDSGDEDVRKAEGDRVFVLDADGRLTAQQDSLWSLAQKGP